MENSFPFERTTELTDATGSGELARVISALVTLMEKVTHISASKELQGIRAFPEFFARHILQIATPDVVNKWEEWITVFGANSLTKDGLSCFGEVPYPKYVGKGTRCDWVFPLKEKPPIWVEFKSVFAETLAIAEEGLGHCFRYDGSGRKNGMSSNSLTKGLQSDVNKLTALRAEDAEWSICFALILESDSKQVDLARAPTELSTWTRLPADPSQWSWPDVDIRRRNLGFREKCVVWYRKVCVQ